MHRLVSVAVLAVALVVATPAWSLPRAAALVHLSPYAGLAWYLAGFELGPWDQYLLNEITPDLERLSTRRLPQVTWLKFDEAIFLPDFALPLLRSQRQSSLRLSLRHARTSLQLDKPLAESGGDLDRFQQSILMPGISHSVSPDSELTVSAVLTRQRFGATAANLQPAAARLGLADGWFDEPTFDPYLSEVSHGAGLRFALSSELVDGVRLETAFQSRISMDGFASVRGVHGTSAELDVPPHVEVGLQLHATARSWLNFGVSQIFYSDITAFPSRALPARFTALLGDRNSPVFAWDDLTVYSLGWRWRADNDDLELYVDYRTRTQPRPTAPALAAMLESEQATNAITAGISRAVGKRSRLHLSAAWAPPEYAFGGNLLGVVSDELSQDLEVQALLSFDF